MGTALWCALASSSDAKEEEACAKEVVTFVVGRTSSDAKNFRYLEEKWNF